MRITLFLLLPALLLTAWTEEDELSRQELERIVRAQQRLLNDWAGLTRYGSENTELTLKPGEERVVFIGDEITEYWGQTEAGFFPGKPYLNRGIAGQTTPQMLVRFRQDVISLQPKVVVIQGGGNDLAGALGPMTQGTAAENIMSMVELAQLHGIQVVLASLTPVCDCFGKRVTTYRTPGKIIGMNSWLKEYAAQSRAVYLDFYSALAEGRSFKKDLTQDGILPNEAGYKIMSQLAEAAIAKALNKK
jgi:lysophospholipase L1-like esterase